MFPEKTKLGNLEIPRLGFGCWQLGGHGWQGLDAAALEAAVRGALDLGASFFDTADVYGLGHSEGTLGRILKSHPKGDSSVVATKFGVRFIDGKRSYDNSPAYMRQALEASRKRLQRDCIDLYQLHWHDGVTDLRLVFDALEVERVAGKIKYYGISNVDLSDWKDIPPGLVSFSFEYSLLNREHEVKIKTMQGKGLTFLSWGSLAQGLLSGKYARGHKFAEGDIRGRDTSLFADRHWDRYEPVLAAMREISSQTGRPLSQIALRWILDGVGGVTLGGIKTFEQLRDNVAAFGWRLPQDAIQKLNGVS